MIALAYDISGNNFLKFIYGGDNGGEDDGDQE
jgi:hypothetical protein